MEIPDDLLLEEVWRFLPAEEILLYCQVNKTLHSICNDNETWIYLIQRDFPNVNMDDFDNAKCRYMLLRAEPKIKWNLLKYSEVLRNTTLIELRQMAVSIGLKSKQRSRSELISQLYDRKKMELENQVCIRWTSDEINWFI